MQLRPARPGVRRPLVVIGVLLVAAAGCADPPTREQTDADMLVELHGARRATVTLEANDVGGLLSPTVAARGGPPTTTTTFGPIDIQHPTPEQLAAMLAAINRRDAHPTITAEIRDPRATFAAIGRALGPRATVTGVRVGPNRLVGTMRFASPVRTTRRVQPAALARALDRGGLPRDDTVWVGVCVAATEGHWTRTPDAFDHSRGCAGWVPDRRASTVGILVSESRPSSTFWPTVGLVLAAMALVYVCVARIRSGRRGWHALLVISAVVLAGIVVVVCQSLIHEIGGIHDMFATGVDRAVADRAHVVAVGGGVLAVAGLGVLLWCASDPARVRGRGRVPDDQPPNRSFLGSSV